MSLNEFLYSPDCIIAYQSHIFIGPFYHIKQSKEGGSPPWAGGGPVAVKSSSLNNRGCKRFEKKFNSANDFLEGLQSVDQLGLPDETLPLNFLVPIPAERRVEDRGLQVDRRVSTIWTVTLFGPGDSPIDLLWKKLLHG